MPDVSEAWDRIHEFLAKRAPKILDNLNPGATRAELAAAEEALGMAMPAPWRELYAAHNGMNDAGNHGSLFYGMNFFTLDRAVAECAKDAAGMAERGADYEPIPVESASPGIRRDDMYNGGWVPFAHDWGDTLLRVDLAPAEGGTWGQVIFTDHAMDAAIRLAPDIGQFLRNFADDLEADRYFLDPQALEDGNEALDCIPEIDLVNWWQSPRWKHLAK